MYWFCSVPNHSRGFHSGHRRSMNSAALMSTPSLVSKIIRPGAFAARTIRATSQTSRNQRQLAADHRPGRRGTASGPGAASPASGW
jgi:hypothetical protein